MYNLDKNIFNLHMALFFNEDTVFPVLNVALKLQEDFRMMFPNEPEIVPLPIDAPKEIPRCIFRNEKDSSITVSQCRIDFDAGIKVNTDWRNHIQVVLLNFLRMCEMFDIRVERVGVVVQAYGNDDIISELNTKVNIVEFKESEEKNMSYVIKKKVDNILLNIITNVIYNTKNNDASKVVSVDVNTDVSNELPDGISDKLRIIQMMIDEIEGKLENVF